MKQLSILLFICMTFLSNLSIANDVPPEVKAIEGDLSAIGQNPILIAAVKKHNAENLSLDSIKKRDADWRLVSGLDDFMTAMMNSAAAKEMSVFEQSQDYFVEMFLMDNQGANVAMTNKTSDYWQGDEAKWQESFKDGKGAVHYGDVEFDESAQAYLIQVSVPVMDAGKAIGAITIGVDLDALGI